MILRWRLIGRIDAFRRRGETRFHVTQMSLRRIADANGLRHEAFIGVEADAGWQRFIVRRQQRGAFRCRLQRFCNHHRDRLVGVTHAVILQEIEPEHERVDLGVRIFCERRPVGRRHDLDDARMIFRRLHIKKCHATTRDAAHRHHGMQHAGRMIVRGIAGLSLHLQHPLAAGLRLANIRAVPDIRRRLRQADFRRHEALRKPRKKEMQAVPESDPAFPPSRASGRE